MSYPFTQLYAPTSTGSLTAAQYNAEIQNIISNHIPESIDDYSVNAAEMRIQTDPGESGTESLATTLSEEIERLRFAIKEAKNMWGSVTYWYETPTIGSTLTRTTNADALIISATNTGFSNTILTLQTAEENTGSFYYLKLISDTDGTPTTDFSVDQDGNVVCGTITSGAITSGQVSTGTGTVRTTDLVLYETTAGTGNGITIACPSTPSAWTLTLPAAAPGATKYASFDTNGVMSFVTADTLAAAITVTGAESIADTKTWTDFSPTFTSMDTETIQEAKYVQIGKIVYWYISAVLNTTGDLSSLGFVLPVAAAAATNARIGSGYVGESQKEVHVSSPGSPGTGATVYLTGVGGTYGTSDFNLDMSGFYRVA